MDNAKTRSRSSESSRKRAMLQHQRLRFAMADMRNGRHLDYDMLAKDDERIKLHSRIGNLEERVYLAEEHLARLFHDIDCCNFVRHSPHSPCVNSAEEGRAAALFGDEVCRTPDCGYSSACAPTSPLVPRPSGRSVRNRGKATVVATRNSESSATEKQQVATSSNTQAADQQQEMVENTWIELCQTKEIVATMQNVLDECRTGVTTCREDIRAQIAQLTFPAAEVQSQLSKFEADHDTIRQGVDRLRHELGRRVDTLQTSFEGLSAEARSSGIVEQFSSRIAELENNQTLVDAQLKKSGRALVGVISDLDMARADLEMVEARVNDRLKALQEQDRALEGRMATLKVRGESASGTVLP